MQKYFNKWLSTAYDLFGTTNSSSAHWAYTWGIKGRYDEHEADRTRGKRQTQRSRPRTLYARIAKLIDQLNQLVPEGQPKLYAPDLKFNRSIGEHVGKNYSVTGELLSRRKNTRNIFYEALPTAEDEQDSWPKSSKARSGCSQIQLN